MNTSPNTGNKPRGVRPKFFVAEPRRTLLAVSGDKECYCVVISPNSYAGGHFHEHKTEQVFVVSGTVRLTIEHDRGESRGVEHVTMQAGQGVFIRPMIAHKFVTENESAVLLVTADMDEKDAGTTAVRM